MLTTYRPPSPPPFRLSISTLVMFEQSAGPPEAEVATWR
jgi:hypothetical protein